MQQAIQPSKHPINAALTLPGSENIAYHALLLAALANGVSEISNIPITENMTAFLNALGQLGIAIQQNGTAQTCIIAGANGKFPKKQATIWCADGEITAQFLLSACATTSGVYYFDGSTHLREKPISALLDILFRQGAQPIPPDARKLPLTLVGNDMTEGGEIILNGTLAHHAISALLIISPYAHSPITFTLLNPGSQSYIDTTSQMMAEFGVVISHIHQGKFMTPIPQQYQARDYAIEPDLSLAAYFLAATAITGGEITITGAKQSLSRQADSKFLSILEKMGCRIVETSEGLTLKGANTLQGIDVNLRNFADTFLALSAIAPFAASPTRINHIGHLSQSETNRMLAVKTEWQRMGINIETNENSIKIYPGTPRGCTINAMRDRRLAMAAAVIGLKTPGMIIDNAETIASIYPDYFPLWETMLQGASTQP